MTDPFDQDGVTEASQNIMEYDFDEDVYATAVVEEALETVESKKFINPPRLIFMPTQMMIRTMIRAVVKWGKTDTEEAFFLRFGLLDDPNWYLKE